MSEYISEALDIANQEAERARQAANRCEDFCQSAEQSQRAAELQAQAASERAVQADQHAHQAALVRHHAEIHAENAGNAAQNANDSAQTAPRQLARQRMKRNKPAPTPKQPRMRRLKARLLRGRRKIVPSRPNNRLKMPVTQLRMLTAAPKQQPRPPLRRRMKRNKPLDLPGRSNIRQLDRSDSESISGTRRPNSPI